MALKPVLKSLDGLDDATKKLYVSKDGEFHLDVEGGFASPAKLTEVEGKLTEFRENNRTLNAELTKAKEDLKKFEGVDLAEVTRMREQDQKLKDKKLIDAGKIDELLESKLQPIKFKFETDLKASIDRNSELTQQLERMAIDDQLTKIGIERGIQPTAIDDFQYRGRQLFKLKDGKVVPLAPDGTIKRNAKGDQLSMTEWVEQLSSAAPHLFKPSSGGGASNNSGKGGEGKTIAGGDPVLFGKNLEQIAKGEVTVQAAG